MHILIVFKKMKISISKIIEKEKDMESLCEWIQSSGELHLISGNTSGVLTIEELHSWVNSSLQLVKIQLDEKIIGLATLSRAEAELPSGYIEICHLIINPNFRRLYYGTTIVSYLTSFAKKEGYKKVLGRVLKTNSIALAFLDSLHWKHLEENYSNDDTVVWLGKNIN